MKKAVLAALMLCLLVGCGEVGGPGSSRPTEPGVVHPTETETETAPPAETSVPTAEASPPEGSGGPDDPAGLETPFGPLPVTENGIWDYYLYEMKGDYIIRDITPYEGDYLVELGHGYEGETMLVWIFGDTGRKVQMTTMGNRTGVEIQGRGSLRFRTDGYDGGTSWRGIPKTCTAVAPAEGDYAAVRMEEAVWLPPAQSVQVGFWDESGMYSQRYEQLCNARITADGLSFSFIPNTDSMEKFQSFFPACTTIPSFETSYDEATGTFTLRLYNTSLKSGALTGEMTEWISGYQNYEDLYPRTVPEGSLGADNLFLTGVEIHQDGDDAEITARLTERAGWFTVESGNLGYDNIPWLALKFREPNSMEVEYG